MDTLMSLMAYGYTIDEIASGKTIECGSSNVYHCFECNKNKVRTMCGGYACPECGVIDYPAVQSYSDTRRMRSKSVHRRSWWMGRRLRDIVGSECVELVVEDFTKVVNMLEAHGLIKGKNVSRYGYYIIRLCHRRRFKTFMAVSDLKDGKIKRKFDYNLFGVVYPMLGWCDDNDEYYNAWKKNIV